MCLVVSQWFRSSEAPCAERSIGQDHADIDNRARRDLSVRRDKNDRSMKKLCLTVFGLFALLGWLRHAMPDLRPRGCVPSVDRAETYARAIRNAANRWRAYHGEHACPTTQQLVEDKEIDSRSRLTDPWDTPYLITCSEEDVQVSSAGPDRKVGTDDDIRVPGLDLDGE